MAPIIRESPPSAMAPSSSEEDASSSDQEMEPQPAKNRRVPVPARQESDDGSGEVEEEESDEVGLPGQLGENGMLTKRPLQRPPPSVRGSSDDYEEESESDESLSEQPSQAEANAPSRKLAGASHPKRKAPQERDGDENEVEGGRDTVGSSDEIGENGVVIRRLPRRPPPQPKEGFADDGDEEESESESGEASSMAPAPRSKGNGPLPELVGTSQLKGNAAATELPKSPPPKEKALPAELAKSPPAKRKAAAVELAKLPLPKEKSPPAKRKAAAVELAKSPLPKEKAPLAELAKSPLAKRKAAAAELPMSPARKKAVAAATTEVPKSPRPKKHAAAAEMRISRSPVAVKEVAKSPQVAAPAGVEGHHGQELKYSAEKHLEEKSESHWYLWQQVLALHAQHPGMSLKKAFLKIPDKKARALDTKVKKQMLAEINQYLRRQGIEKEVVRTLSSLIR
ncbi:hypothetical protein ACP70R_049720 [Stipagrostis hirtigluma subsp. patula]